MSQLHAVILVGIAYIGAKASKRDTYFNTGLEFERGQVHQVPAVTANQMARHTDVYALESSQRYKEWLAKFESGELDQEPVTAPQTHDAQTLVNDKVTELQLELQKFPRKDMIRDHEVTKALGLEFDADMKMSDMVDAVCAAYQAKLETQLAGQ